MNPRKTNRKKENISKLDRVSEQNIIRLLNTEQKVLQQEAGYVCMKMAKNTKYFMNMEQKTTL